MISVTGITDKYIVQPALLEKHGKTLNWLSSTLLWKSQLIVFQQMLDKYSGHSLTSELKKQMEQLQNLVTFSSIEVIEELRKKLRAHENRLAKMLETRSEWEVAYYREHDALMDEAAAIELRMGALKTELLQWVTTIDQAK
jgi:hypothetical protein